MRPRLLMVAAIAAASLLLFGYVVRQLSYISVGLAANRDVEALLRQSLEDQKKLARLDPAQRTVYRQRFDATRVTIANLDVLALTRREITNRIEIVLVAVVGLILGGSAVVYLVEHRSREQRLARLGVALEALSRGEEVSGIGEKRRDVIGRIASMIEETSRVMARDQRRMRYLENLDSWQEAARRHAHEIRTPLTAAQMEVRRLASTMAERHPESAGDVLAFELSINEELEHLRRFTSSFSSFATIGKPRVELYDLAAFVDEFAAKFAPSWPSLRLETEAAQGDCRAAIDRDMIRRVLVNLCNNSAGSCGEGCTVAMRVRRDDDIVEVIVSDDGPGIAPAIRSRLFQPYTTTREVGEGMGLGLAISRKIMLDHGGDLEYVDSARGATFRLVFRAPEAA